MSQSLSVCFCVCVRPLTEDFQLGADRQVGVLYWARVEALIVMGDIGDLQHPVDELIHSGICQKGGGAAALPAKDTRDMHTQTHTS